MYPAGPTGYWRHGRSSSRRTFNAPLNASRRQISLPAHERRASRHSRLGETPAVLLRLGRGGRGLRDHGRRRQRAHGVLAALSADPRRVRWERGVTAGAFSFGFLVSAVLSPALGRLMDRRGPLVVMELGAAMMAAGLLLATLVREPWHLYATLGVLVGGG